MGTHHMVSNARWEPQRQNNFEVYINGLVGATDLMLAVSSFTPPEVSVEALKIPYGNNEFKVAGKPTVSSATLKVRDYIGVNTSNILQNWYNLVYNNKTQKIGLSKDYKKSANLIEYAPDGSTPRQWDMYGCWISNLNIGEFSQESGLVELSATIECDWCEPRLT